MDKLYEMKELIEKLNQYCDEYYNNNNSMISDKEYDKFYDALVNLEKTTGVVFLNSPTHRVGYEVKSSLEKVKHPKKLLSLDKTQDINEFNNFVDVNNCILMPKWDGLTIDITYEDGKLVRGVTRGDGEFGEDITHNLKTIKGIPLEVPIKRKFRVSGEAIILKNDFLEINNEIMDPAKKYKNPRNLAAGSIRQFDSSVCVKRKVLFVCWNANDLSNDGTMFDGLSVAQSIGFNTTDVVLLKQDKKFDLSDIVESEHQRLLQTENPFDGLVAMYNDIEYGNSLGCTSHHPRNGFAFKFYDEEEKTILREIKWSQGKTGVLTPVAIFDSVELDGTTVSKASVHNVSCLEQLNLCLGDRISVYKANQIIPQIRKNYTQHENTNEYNNQVPKFCPFCNSELELQITRNKDKDVKILKCNNSECGLLGVFNHFVSKSAMDIKGLSESTLEKLINLGILNKLTDIYDLKNHVDKLYSLEGYGDKSIENLLNSIENSRITTLSKFINSLSIPGVGKSTAKDLEIICEGDIFKLKDIDLSIMNGFGSVTSQQIYNWFHNPENIKTVEDFLNILTITSESSSDVGNLLYGKSFVITGKLIFYPNRDSLISEIENNGGSVQSSVSSSTTYLINNDIESTSGKNKKAKELGVNIITEEQFRNILGSSTQQNVTKQTQNKSSRKSLF